MSTNNRLLMCVIGLAMLTITPCSVGANQPLGTGTGLDTEKVAKEYGRWLSASFPKDFTAANPGEIHIEIPAVSSFQFKGATESFSFYRIRAIDSKPGFSATATRMLGVARDATGNSRVFFDTGFAMPDCGDKSDGVISLGEINRIQLAHRPVLVVEKIGRPIVCDGVSTQEKRTTLLFFAQSPFNEVLELNTGYVNFHNDSGERNKHPEYSRSIVVPNGCTDEAGQACAYLTVWGMKSIKNYSWNSDKTRLVADNPARRPRRAQ